MLCSRWVDDKNHKIVFNPFVPNAPFFYPLKTSENRKVGRERCIGNKWVNKKVKTSCKLSIK